MVKVALKTLLLNKGKVEISVKRIIMLGALALLLVTAGCARKASFLPPPEIVNNVEGSFTFKDETVKLNHAYARRVENEDDNTKQDVVIVFTDRPAPWSIIDNHGNDSKIQEKAREGELRALSIRLKDENNATFTIYHHGTGGFEYPSDFREEVPPVKAEFKPVRFTPNLVEGRVSVKYETKAPSNQETLVRDKEGNLVGTTIPKDPYGDQKPEPPNYQFDVSFKVALRTDEWTGVYHKFPPTNLEPGKANGQLVVDGKAIKLNHAYARQSGYDLFEKTNVVFLLTEKPINVETLKGDSKDDLLRAALEAGNSYVICDNFSTLQPPLHPSVWSLGKLPGATKTMEEVRQFLEASNWLHSAEVDLSQFDNKALDGKIYTKGVSKSLGPTYEVDVSFNAPVITIGDAVNAPVVASTGQPLPVGGGAAGPVYLIFVKAVSLTKNFQELRQLLAASQSAGASAEMKKSLERVPAEEEQQMFGLLKGVLTITDPVVEGGFISGDKATLWVTGMEDGKKLRARVNMHLENHQWKVGKGATQVK